MSRLHLLPRMLSAAAALALLAGAPAAVAGPIQGTNTISTPDGNGSDLATHRLAGDFNGDGYDDYVTTVTNSGDASWTASVVFGSASLANIDITRNAAGAVNPIGSRGVQIRPVADAAVNQYFLGLPTAVGLGDVDRDGYDDLAISTPTRDKTSAHKVFVVYGGAGNADISLGNTSRVTTVVVSASGSDVRSDAKVSSIGDFDGDGYADLAVTRSTGKTSDSSVNPGASIVRGGPRTGSIDATKTGTRVSHLSGQRSCQFVLLLFKNVCSPFTITITGIGDFNGDGKDDVVFDNGKDDAATILLGRTGSFSVSAGTVKLTGATAVRSWVSSSVAALGDVNGDGLKDVGFEGPRIGTNGERRTMSVLLGRTNPGTAVTTVGIPNIQSATQSVVAIGGVGDQTGDGRGEVAVSTGPKVGYEGDPYRRNLKILGVGTASTIQVDPIAVVPGLPTEGVDQYEQIGILGAAGNDFDRDGKADLIYTDGYNMTATIISSGVDRAGPELFGAYSYNGDPAFPSIRPGIKLEPYDFSTSAGTTRTVWPREAATVEFKVSRTDGTLIGTTTRSAPAGKSTDGWNGTVGSTTLAQGRYYLDVTAKDALGNRGHSIRYPFGIVSSGNEAGEPATILLKAKLTGPDGSINANGSVLEVERGCSGNLYTQALPPEPYSDGAPYLSGENCVITAKPTDVNGRICDQDYRVTVNGSVVAGSTSGSANYRLVKGENVVEFAATCRERAAGSVPGPLATDGWVARGDVWWGGNPEEVWLTTQPNQTSSTVWNAPFDPREKTFEFATYVGGGDGAGEGLTMSFLPADQTDPATGFIGTGGAKLGIGGLPAFALAIDYTKSAGDPRANNLGFVQGATSTGLNWLQSADPGTKLNVTGKWVTFKLVSKAGTLSVYVNGSLKLTRAQTLPSSAYLAFTGANSTQYQEIYVGRFKVTNS